MKYYILLVFTFLSINLLAQNTEEVETTNKEGHNYIMTGVQWNWSPHVQVKGYYTEREPDIGLDLRLIRAMKNNRAMRYSLGLKLGANQFYGEQYIEEDTAISPLYQHDFFGLYAGLGTEWQKIVQGNLVLFAGGDITFGTSKVQLYQKLVTSKKQPTYDSIGDPSGGRAYFGAIIPTIGLRYNIGRFAMSYAILTPWQFQHTTWANLSHFKTFVRPKHAVRFGYHFYQNRKPKKTFRPL
jgi:hypothetical protein